MLKTWRFSSWRGGKVEGRKRKVELWKSEQENENLIPFPENFWNIGMNCIVRLQINIHFIQDLYAFLFNLYLIIYC